MDHVDPDLRALAETGLPALPDPGLTLSVERPGATIVFTLHGAGPAVCLLHGGMGSKGNFAWQIPFLVQAGYRVIAVDSRAQGASGWDGSPLTYAAMADDLAAILDRLSIDRAAIIGWSDGADVGLMLARARPERVAGLFFFACNVDPTGTLPFEFTPVIGRALDLFRADYQALSATPERFDAVFEAVNAMQQGQPNLSAQDLAGIAVPVLVAIGEHDEFIRREHMAYLAETLPDARLEVLAGVGHFAPWQHPALFNRTIAGFLARIGW